MRLNPQGQAAYLLRGWGTYHLIPKFQHLKAGEYLAGPALSWSRSVIALGSRVRTRSAQLLAGVAGPGRDGSEPGS
jgi:hypothetical protein